MFSVTIGMTLQSNQKMVIQTSVPLLKLSPDLDFGNSHRGF